MPNFEDHPWRELRWRLVNWAFGTWPLAVAGLWLWRPAAAVGYFVAAHTVALWSALMPNSQLFGRVVRSFDTTRREVWLTIDDGPFPGDMRAMLEVLARHDAKATFFIECARGSAEPEVLRAIVAAGHGLGNHSMSHQVGRFWASGPWYARREIEPGEELLHSDGSAGFRPPVGMANGFVHRVARRLGVPVIGWSVRGFDGVKHDPAKVAARMAAEARPGAILLLHQREQGNAPTLELVLTALAAQGLRCVVPDASRYRCQRA